MTPIRWTTFGLAAALLLAITLPGFQSLDAQEKAREKKEAAGKPAQADGKPADATNPFADKVLLVQKQLDQSPSIIQSENVFMGPNGFVIENASVIEFGGIRFLSGKGIERLDGKVIGPRICIPMTRVGAILVFDGVEAFKRYEEQQTERMMLSLDRNGLQGIDLGVPVDPAE